MLYIEKETLQKVKILRFARKITKFDSSIFKFDNWLDKAKMGEAI